MEKSEFRNLIKRELIKEAKGTSYEAKLAEIENQGHITTLEAKIDAISEMIDAKNDRLSLVNEDENLAELIDKKKIKEMQKEIKQLEKTKMKLEKLYEKKTGGKKKDVVIDEDARTDAEEEGYIDGMEDEKEDVEEACSTSYEEDDTDSMNENVYGSIGFIPRDKDSKPEHPRFREMSAEEIQDYIDANPNTLWGSSLSMAKMIRDEKLGMGPMNEEFNRFRKLAGIPLKEESELRIYGIVKDSDPFDFGPYTKSEATRKAAEYNAKEGDGGFGPEYDIMPYNAMRNMLPAIERMQIPKIDKYGNLPTWDDDRESFSAGDLADY